MWNRAKTANKNSGRWQSQQPFSVAGFNLGEYRSAVVPGPPQVAIYANQQLENAIADRLRGVASGSIANNASDQADTSNPYAIPPQSVSLPPTPPPQSRRRVEATGPRSFRFDFPSSKKPNGNFPFDHLDVAQIPGTFGQGWPQLIYLSTLAFLPAEAQQRVGMDEWSEREARELMPFHEVAHQWWGNVSAGATYRDVWLEEGIANYLAMLYAIAASPQTIAWQNGSITTNPNWSRNPSAPNEPLEQAGPLSLGLRLSGMPAPHAYTVIVYGKGAWVIYMLSEMFRDSAAKDPDENFRKFLHSVLDDYVSAPSPPPTLKKKPSAI